MNYRDFGEYVASYDEFADSLALTSRPFLKIERLTHRELRSLTPDSNSCTSPGCENRRSA
jgi:hypothetical protein